MVSAAKVVLKEQSVSNSTCDFARHIAHFGDDLKKDRKRREIAGRLSREMADKKDL